MDTKQEDAWKTRLVLLVWILITGALTAWIGWSVYRSATLVGSGVEAQGTVQNVRRGSKGGPDTVTVLFRTASGTEVTAEGSSQRLLGAGQTVQLWYDPADPTKIDFGNTRDYNLRGASVSGFMFLLGCYLFVRTFRQARS